MDTACVSEPATELRAGQAFAGWRVERELARGGMGVLYLAHHPRLPRTDVIKMLSPYLSSDARFRARFLREVTRMSTLSHPHVMPIHDSGEAPDGTLYLVMPYVAGGDLRNVLNEQGPFAPARAVRMIDQLAAALDAAHRVGVVHRDVKPENVLLSAVEPQDADHALLTDFGISRDEMSNATLTATGELLLTPAYAAPEQVLGKPIDARVDQYALGCILYELLSGRPPFLDDAPVVMLMAHLQDPIPSLAAQGLPAAIDDVLARAMAKSPEQRYATCRDLARAAAAALEVPMTAATHQSAPPGRFATSLTQPLPVDAAAPTAQAPPPRSLPPELPYVQPQHPKRPRKRFVAGALVAVAVLGGGAVAAVVSMGGSDPPSAYTALVNRLPTAVRGTCSDGTKDLVASERPYVETRATCFPTISGRRLTMIYRTVKGDTATIKRYRSEVLHLGGLYHSPGNCMTFQSTDPTHNGTQGFGQEVHSPPVVGAVWCNKDGSFWYLQTAPAAGQLPIMTHLTKEPTRGVASAPQRFADLEAVAPAADES